MEQQPKKYLNIDEILDVIKDLSHSQGFYGRLLNSIMEFKNSYPDNWNSVVNELESQHFTCPLDVVLYFEQ